MDHRLLELLICPVCKGPLEALRGADAGPILELACHADRLAYPIRDGILFVLEQEARVLPALGSDPVA